MVERGQMNVDIGALLERWPVQAVPRHLIPQEAHHQAVEFQKRSGASPAEIDELMIRLNSGANLDRYFERRIEMLELDWEDDQPRSEP